MNIKLDDIDPMDLENPRKNKTLIMIRDKYWTSIYANFFGKIDNNCYHKCHQYFENLLKENIYINKHILNKNYNNINKFLILKNEFKKQIDLKQKKLDNNISSMINYTNIFSLEYNNNVKLALKYTLFGLDSEIILPFINSIKLKDMEIDFLQ